MTLSKFLIVLNVLFLCDLVLSCDALSADTICGTQSCSEAICSTPNVIECSDWNDGGTMMGGL